MSPHASAKPLCAHGAGISCTTPPRCTYRMCCRARAATEASTVVCTKRKPHGASGHMFLNAPVLQLHAVHTESAVKQEQPTEASTILSPHASSTALKQMFLVALVSHHHGVHMELCCRARAATEASTVMRTTRKRKAAAPAADCIPETSTAPEVDAQQAADGAFTQLRRTRGRGVAQTPAVGKLALLLMIGCAGPSCVRMLECLVDSTAW